MKKFLILLNLLILGSISICNAQILGTKKNVVLKLISFECGDNCSIELKDISSGVVYNFDNFDEKTKDNGILEIIQELYYNGEKTSGKLYKATIEFRKTNIMKQLNTDEPPVKTGKQKTKWMINSLSK